MAKSPGEPQQQCREMECIADLAMGSDFPKLDVGPEGTPVGVGESTAM